MKEIVVDPHKTDFFVQSLKSKVLGRKPLLKYSRRFDEYVFSVEESNLGAFIDILHATLWNLCFSKKYGFSLKRLFRDQKDKSRLYFALPSVRESALGNFNYVYFSHAHLYKEKLTRLGTYQSVTFISENDVSNSRIVHELGLKRFEIQRFTIRKEILKRGKTGLYSLDNSILITGTFHRAINNRIFRNKVAKDWGIETLHDVREFVTCSDLSYVVPNLKVKTSELKQTNFFNAVLNGRQRSYFRFDIVQEMLDAKYAIIDVENLTDIVPINFAESILCGCIPIVPKRLVQIESLQVFSSALITFEDKEDLRLILTKRNKEICPKTFERLQNHIKNIYA